MLYNSYYMDNGFAIEKNEGDLRIKAKGKTESEALSFLVNGLSSCQLAPGEVVIADGEDKSIKIGYSNKKYLPSDLINDIIVLQSANGQIYPDVSELSFSDGVLRANLVGAKRKPSLEVKEALYLNSVFQEDGDGFLAQVDVIV